MLFIIVCYTKEHHQRFKKSTVCAKDSFLLMTGLDVNIVEVLDTLEFYNKLRDNRSKYLDFIISILSL